MSEFLKNMLDNLNNYAGLFSLFAVLASIIVPCIIYKKENKAKKQAMQDELESIQEMSRFPMSMQEREFFTKKSMLEKGLKRK